jgi:hypothetical protein
MLRITLLTAGFAFAAGAVASAQLPPQPPPVATPSIPLPGQANEQERAACQPDVKKFCQTQLEANPDDVLGILSCLQTNRARLRPVCQQVLASHGQ